MCALRVLLQDLAHFSKQNSRNTVRTVFAHLDRLVSRHILSGSLTGNSCSAALTCVFVLREEFAFLFQTFSRSDPLRQKKKKRKKEKEKNTVRRSISLQAFSLFGCKCEENAVLISIFQCNFGILIHARFNVDHDLPFSFASIFLFFIEI